MNPTKDSHRVGGRCPRGDVAHVRMGIVYRTVRAPAPDWNAGMAFQTGIDAAVKNALAEAGRSLRDVKALDLVSIGLRGDELDEWEALVRISFLVDNIGD